MRASHSAPLYAGHCRPTRISNPQRDTAARTRHSDTYGHAVHFTIRIPRCRCRSARSALWRSGPAQIAGGLKQCFIVIRFLFGFARSRVRLITLVCILFHMPALSVGFLGIPQDSSAFPVTMRSRTLCTRRCGRHGGKSKNGHA
jgi:hypothetical protein